MAKPDKKGPIDVLLLRSIHLADEGHQEKFTVIKVENSLGKRLLATGRAVEPTPENLERFKVNKGGRKKTSE